jgi:poly-gamma-glutamate synthesis protein (capsule biosynthesis protein)
MRTRILALLLCLFLLTACTQEQTVKSTLSPTGTLEGENIGAREEAKDKILALTYNLDETSKNYMSRDFLTWFSDRFGTQTLFALRDEIQKGTLSENSWHRICGNTPLVLKDLYTGVLDPQSPNFRSDIRVIETDSENATIRIVGDVSLADNWKIMPKLDASGKGIDGILSRETLSLLRDADVFLLNNEFTFSDRGKPLPSKAYTFRANPSRVSLLHDMGADIVSLANNHAYDYGADAFGDTLEILKGADIPYIGAGKDSEEAAKPVYFIIGGRKYAFSAATKAEKYILTPEAGENRSGVMRTYDPTKYLEVIRKAEEECDYNIVYVHWGREDSHKVEAGLYEMAVSYIDAGADAVVGAHAHVLQGIEFYNSVPIVYNLGNFIFNAKTVDTGILEISVDKEGTPSYRFIPAIQKGCYTSLANEVESARILAFMEKISFDTHFDENGFFSPAEKEPTSAS